MSVRIEFISSGFRDVLFSQGVKDVVQETADTIKEKANANNTHGGEGYESNVIAGGYGGGRYIGFVKSTDKASVLAESEDLALTRAAT